MMRNEIVSTFFHSSTISKLSANKIQNFIRVKIYYIWN